MTVRPSWRGFLELAGWVVPLLACLVPPIAQARCPSDVLKATESCTAPYRSALAHMHQSREALCCGVDVETVRSYCQAYNRAMTCVTSLRRMCTHSSDVIRDGAGELGAAGGGVAQLCGDDAFIERYAMHQHCLRAAGASSQACFSLVTHSRTHFLSTVSVAGDFCRDMRSVVQCVRGAVRAHCSVGAVTLVDVLVPPMVRGSERCQYRVTQPTTHRGGNPSYISDGHKTRDTSGNPGADSSVATPLMVSYFAVLCSLVLAILFGNINPS